MGVEFNFLCLLQLRTRGAVPRELMVYEGAGSEEQRAEAGAEAPEDRGQRTGVSHLRREYGELGMPQVSFDFFERKLLGQL